MFCADELRALRSNLNTLNVYGYADPEGSHESNLDLSEHRARNVKQAIQDIVGNVEAEFGETEGEGESPAQDDGGVQDGSEAPEWRRVEVNLERNIQLELHGPPKRA